MAHRIRRNVRGRGVLLVRWHRRLFHQLRQIRGRGPRQRLLQVAAARQRLQRRRCCLQPALHVAARAVRRHHRLVRRRVRQRLTVIRPRLLLLLLRLQRRLIRLRHLPPGRLRRPDVPRRAHRLHHLPAQRPHRLRQLQALLLLLLVKQRTQPVRRVCRIPAQARHVLLLTARIADDQRPLTHRRVRGAAGVTAPPQRHQRRRRGHRRRFQRIHQPRRRAQAYPAAAVRHRKLGPVVNIAKAQRARLQPVFLRAGRRAYHRAVQLGVPVHAHVIPALTGKQPGLLLHAVKTAAQCVPAGPQIGAAGHAANGQAAARRHAGLRRVIAVAVLLARQPQVAAHVRHNALAAHLRPGQPRVAAAGQAHLMPRIHRGLRPAVAAAELTAAGRIAVGKHAEPGPAIAQADADTDIPAAAVIAAAHRLGVARRQQVNRPRRVQRHIVGRLHLAADGGDIPLARHHADIMARVQRRGKTLPLLVGLAARRALRPQRHADANKRRSPQIIGIQLCALIRLIPRQRRLHPFQRPQPAVALRPRRLHRLHPGVDGRAHHA